MADRRTVALLGLGLAAGGLGVWLSRQGLWRGPAPDAAALVGTAWPGEEGRALTQGLLAAPGGQVLLWAWASWCPHCRSSAPALRAVAAAGTPVWGLLSWDDPARAADALRAWGVPYARLAVDRDGRLARARGARGVPHGVLIGPDGAEIRRIPGRLDVGRARTEGLL